MSASDDYPVPWEALFHRSAGEPDPRVLTIRSPSHAEQRKALELRDDPLLRDAIRRALYGPRPDTYLPASPLAAERCPWDDWRPARDIA